jgi:hypothetical protein
MLRIRILLCALLACTALGVGAIGASQALASHGQTVYFEAGQSLLEPAKRPAAIAQMQSLGVRAIRVELYWRDVAPNPTSAVRPSFDATDPAAYNWGQYDALMAEAQRLHWKVLLTVSGPVPKWATASKKDYLTRPEAAQFGKFMTAVGRHYGSQVSLFAIWNEPNHPDFLLPQFVKGVATSPRIYRSLFQDGYAGLQAAGISHPKVLMGETAPTGTAREVSPLAFLRGVLCLNAKYKKASSCGSLPAYGYGHHAYTNGGGPTYRPPNSQDVMIGVLSRLTHALDLAARAHAIKPNMGVYLTEFGIQSKPNPFVGVPVAEQAEWDAMAERIAYNNPRVQSFSQYLLQDDPVGEAPGSAYIGFQTGLEYVTGKPKPLYAGWPVPLAVAKQGSGFSLWGLARLATGSSTVTVLDQPKGSKSFRVLKTVHTNSLGYWTLHSSTRASSWRVRWTSPAGVKYEGPPIKAH